jgi:sulfur carrier protein ThiS
MQMPDLQPWAAGAWRALWTLLVNPLLYLGLVLQVWEHLRTGHWQRRQLGVRTPWSARALAARWMAGLCAGIAVTAVLLALGVAVPASEVAGVAALAVLFALIRPGWLGAAIVIPAAVLGAAAIRWLPWPAPWRGSRAWTYGAGWHSEAWLAVLACAALAEAALLAWGARRAPYPVAVRGRRGRPVGALLLQSSFMVPVAVWAPAADHGARLTLPGLLASWHWPWLAGGSALWLAVGIPLWVGASSAALGELPQPATRPLIRGAVCVAAVAALGAAGARWWHPAMAPAAALLALSIRAVAVWRQRERQTHREPLFVPHPGGVRVLGVVQGSLADKLGLRPGEVIVQVNQVPVHTAYDLHFALDQNPAYARLHVLDVRGELRIVGGAVYTGVRHQLGLIPVPEGRIPVLDGRGGGLFAALCWRLEAADPENGGHDAPAGPPMAADPVTGGPSR